jgi:hypothetical protein
MDSESETTQSSNNTCVYIGDSLTDVLALLHCDVGVIVGNSRSLRRICATFGVQIKPLFAAVLSRAKMAGKEKGVLYEAASWDEINLALFGTKEM